MTLPVRFIHATKNPRLRYTIAFAFTSENGRLTIHYGVAQCSKYDNFNRASGRQIAEGRLNKALLGNPNHLRSATFTVDDGAGLSVGRLCCEHFEAARSVCLQLQSDPLFLAGDKWDGFADPWNYSLNHVAFTR